MTRLSDDLPADQEDKANEALGALHGLYDILTDLDHGATVKAASISYLIKLCIYSAERAIPDGCPAKRPRAVNDIDSS